MSPSLTVRKIFWVAAAVNLLGVPLLTRMFTNQAIVRLDPHLFSTPSLILIVIWGLAYLAASPIYHQAPYLSLAFAGEKLFYGTQWFLWLVSDRPAFGEIWKTDLFAGVWYSIYGVVDSVFGLFFLYVFFRYRRTSA